MTTSSTGAKQERIQRWVLTLCVISAFAALFLCVFWLRHVGRMRKREARSFLSQVIESINDQTDFYKKHSRNQALEDIEKDRDKISDN